MYIFCLSAIEKSLKIFKKEFPKINDRLAMRRETFTDQMISQILDAYDFLNSLLKKEINLFTPAGLYALLEMNHIVLCGIEQETRMQYYQHLAETRNIFLMRIKPIKEWVIRKNNAGDPYKLAAGFYSRMLSRPQLFLEGNHRTGNILLNYLLLSKRVPPFIVSAENAHMYLDVSGDIKFAEKGNLDTALRMPGHRKRFQTFLREHADLSFIKNTENKP